MTLIGINAVAEMCGVTPTVIRSWCAAGYLSHTRTAGNTRRFDDSVIRRLIECGQAPHPDRLRCYPLIRRLWANTTPSADGCWLYGSLNANGYGQISDNSRGRRTRLAHRLMYELVIGAVPEGLQLDHLCRNRACVNPWHLEPVTCRENLRRGVGWSGRNARKTHCVHGHPLAGDNLTVVAYVTAGGPQQGRECKRCHADREAARRARLRQAEAAA